MSEHEVPRSPINWTVEEFTSDYLEEIGQEWCDPEVVDKCPEMGDPELCSGHVKDEDRVYGIKGPDYIYLEEVGRFWRKKDAELVIKAIQVAATAERAERPLYLVNAETGETTKVPEMSAAEVLEASKINQRLLRAARAVLEEFVEGDVEIHCGSLSQLKGAVDATDVRPSC